MEKKESPTKNDKEEERKQLFQDSLQFKDEFSEGLSNPQKNNAEAKKPENSKKDVLMGEGNLTLVKLIFLQRLQEKQNCIQPIKDFRIIKILMHQPQFFEKKQESEEINPKIFEQIHLMKGNIKEVKNMFFSGNMVFNKILNFSHGEAKIETIKGQKNEEFIKQFSRNSYTKQDSNEKDKIESNSKPKNALTDKIAIFNNKMTQKNTPTEKNNNNAPKIQKVQSLKEKYEKAVNDTNSKTIEKPKINNNLNTESIRNGNNRFSLETITEKNGESCSQIFDGDMAASRKTYGGKLSISQHVIKEEDDDIIKKNKNYSDSNENNSIRKENENKMGKNEETKNDSPSKNEKKEKQEVSTWEVLKKEELLKQQKFSPEKKIDSNILTEMEKSKNDGSLKNENKEKQEISTRNDSKEGELLKQQNFSPQKKIDSNISSENKEQPKKQQNLIPTSSEPKPFKNKDNDSNKTWIKKNIEKEETKIKETKQKEEEEEEKTFLKSKIKKKEENEKEKDNDLPQGKKTIMEKLMKLPFQTYPGQKVLKSSQTMKETLSHDINDDYNEVFFLFLFFLVKSCLK